MKNIYILLVIVLILLVLFPRCTLPLAAVGIAAVAYSVNPQKVGGYCSLKDFNNTFMNTQSGRKTEASIRHMFTCFTKIGLFGEVHGDTNPLPWLYRVDDAGQKVYLDLDGFNSHLNLAFEYNGIDHYRNIYGRSGGARTPKQEKANKRFLRYTENDRIRKNLVEANNVHLIILHYEIPLEIMPDYVKSRLSDIGALKRDTPFTYIAEIPEPAVDEVSAPIKNKIVINKDAGSAAKNGQVIYVRKT